MSASPKVPVGPVTATVTRAAALDARLFHQPLGPGEMDIPAIRGVGGSILHFIDAKSGLDDVWQVEFTPTGELPSHFSGTLPFSVPKGIVKAGSEIVLGYGKESVKWKVPGK